MWAVSLKFREKHWLKNLHFENFKHLIVGTYDYTESDFFLFKHILLYSLRK